MQAACLRGHQAPPVLPPRAAASPLTRGACGVWRAPLSRSSPGRGADGQPERLKSTKGALAVPPEPPPSVPPSAPVAPQRCQQLWGSLSQHSSSGTSSAMPAVPMEAPGPVPVPWPAEAHPPSIHSPAQSLISGLAPATHPPQQRPGESSPELRVQPRAAPSARLFPMLCLTLAPCTEGALSPHHLPKMGEEQRELWDAPGATALPCRRESDTSKTPNMPL